MVLMCSSTCTNMLSLFTYFVFFFDVIDLGHLGICSFYTSLFLMPICQSVRRIMPKSRKYKNDEMSKKNQIDQDAIYQDVVNVNMSNSEMVKHIKVSTYQNAKHVKQSKRRIYRKCTNSKTSQMSKYKSYQ